MNFTQEQIKQILQEVVEEQDGFNKLPQCAPRLSRPKIGLHN